MAYGLYLYKQITTRFGVQRIEIHKNGFSGTATEIGALAKDGVSIGIDAQSAEDTICTSVLNLSVIDDGSFDWSALFTPNSTLYKVIWKTNSVVRWTGFITPDSFRESLTYHDTISLTARDNIGRLNDYTFDMPIQMATITSILSSAMTKAGVAMPLTISTTKVSVSASNLNVKNALVNTLAFQGKTWHEAITSILEGIGCRLRWSDGNQITVTDLSTTAASGQSAIFVNKSGLREIQPAWKGMVISQSYGARESFYDGQFTKEDAGSGATFTPPSSGKWTVAGSMELANPYIGAPNPYQTIFPPVAKEWSLNNSMSFSVFVPAGFSAVRFTFAASNTAWAANGSSIIAQRYLWIPTSGGGRKKINYSLQYHVNVFFVRNGVTYVMREGWEEWEEYKRTHQEYDYFLKFDMPVSTDGIDIDNEVSIYADSFPGEGTLIFRLYPSVVFNAGALIPLEDFEGVKFGRITNLQMLVANKNYTGVSKSISINDSHNVRGSQSLSIGQVPEGQGNALAFVGGLFRNDTAYSPLTRFKRSAGASVEYNLLELVAREHITWHKTSYDRLSGTIMGDEALRFDKYVSYDAKAYQIIGARLSILSNTMAVQVMQQIGPFDDAAHTIVDYEEEGSTFTPISGGGGGGGVSVDKYWRTIEATASTPEVEASKMQVAILDGALYALQGDGTEQESLLKMLEIVNVAEQGQQPEWAIRTPLHFFSEKDISAGGYAAGQESDTGALYTCIDVTAYNNSVVGRDASHPALQGDILTFDGMHWHAAEPTATATHLYDLLDVPDYRNYANKVLRVNAGNELEWGEAPASGVTSFGGQTGAITVRGGQSANGSVNLVMNENQLQAAIVGLGTAAFTASTAYAASSHTHSQYLTGITSSMVTSALGYTPYNAANISSASVAYAASAGSAPASDVYSWAKQSTKPSYSYGDGYLTGFGTAAAKDTIGEFSSVQHTNYPNNQAKLATMSFLSYWNGAYNSSHDSNLTYCANGTIIGSGNIMSQSVSYASTAGSASSASTASYATSSGSADYATSAGNSSLLENHAASYFATAAQLNNYLPLTGGTLTGSLTVQGNVTASGDVTAGSSSDARFKDNRIDLRNADWVLTNLRPMEFDWNDLYHSLGGRNKGHDVGFLAQEVQPLIPSAIGKIYGNYLRLDYNKVTPYLVAGWQRHETRLQYLERRVNELEVKLNINRNETN